MPGRRRPGRVRRPDLGQYFLASDALATRLVTDAAIGPDDRVVELGAGTGILTRALAMRASHVLTVEVEPALSQELARHFADVKNVTVVCGDATTLPMPMTPYRVVANPAFNTTGATLHHLLDDPSGGLVRADLVVQWQVARSRARGGDLLGATWEPWWEFRRGRRIPASLFRPAPSVDAALLIVERRPTPYLPIVEFERYAMFVRDVFASGSVQPTGARQWVSRYLGRT